MQRYRGVLVEGSTPEDGGRVGQKTKTKKNVRKASAMLRTDRLLAGSVISEAVELKQCNGNLTTDSGACY